MTNITVETIIQPLIQQHIFSNYTEATHVSVRDYVRHQLRRFEKKVARFEKRYGMTWEQFDPYTAARTTTLREANLTPEQRKTLSQAIMQEEDDWLEWKAMVEMQQSWRMLLTTEFQES